MTYMILSLNAQSRLCTSFHILSHRYIGHNLWCFLFLLQYVLIWCYCYGCWWAHSLSTFYHPNMAISKCQRIRKQSIPLVEMCRWPPQWLVDFHTNYKLLWGELSPIDFLKVKCLLHLRYVDVTWIVIRVLQLILDRFYTINVVLR